MSRPSVIVALRREAMYFHHGAAVIVAGIGPGAASSATRAALDGPAPPDLVISAGFSGGLRPDLKPGDLVFASEVIDDDGRTWPASHSATMACHVGRLLSLAAVVADPAEKARLGEAHGALAVDMESAAVARACHERGVPFAALRAISDGVDTRLSPALLDLLRNGEPSAARVLFALVRRPALVRELRRLARDTRVAARRLAEGLRVMLTAPGRPAPP